MENSPTSSQQPQPLDPVAIVSAGAVSAPQAYPQPQRIVVEHRTRGGFLRWIAWSGFGLFFFLFLLTAWKYSSAYYKYFDSSHGITEQYFSGEKYASDKIAIITISGVIMEGNGFVKHQIDRIREDENVKAIVVRVDSPGGTVTGSDYIFHHLTKLRQEKKVPMVVSMGSMAASGGYYVSMAVGDEKDSIFAEPTTTTGSIGVIIPHYNFSGWMKEHDIVDDSIKSHPRKQMLSMTRPMDPEHRKILKAYVDESFERFKSIVKKGRPAFRKDTDALDQLATGEIFSADTAKKFGLVDKIGFIEDAIDRAAELAGVNAKNVRVIEFNRPATLMSQFTGSARAHSGNIDLATLLDLSSPRAYYLATSLPSLLSSRRAD